MTAVPTVNEAADEKSDLTTTTIQWLSPSTRRKEYARMDRANSGIRRLVRKVVPRCVSGPAPPRFFDEDKSDVGSVRRYRMDLDEEEEADAVACQEKEDVVSAGRTSKGAEFEERRERRWACF